LVCPTSLDMGIWICHHAIITTHCRSWLGKSAKILGRYLVQNDTWMHCLRLQTHMEWFPRPLYTYDRCLGMGIWICHHAITTTHCRLRLRKSAEIWGCSCLFQNKALVHCLRLQANMEWFPHPLHTYDRCWTTIICCGWGYGYGSVIMPLTPHIVGPYLGNQPKSRVAAWCQMAYECIL